MKKITLLIVLVFACVSLSFSAQTKKIIQRKGVKIISKSDLKMNHFVDSLIAKMTIDEKLGQLNLVTPIAQTGPFATKNFKEKVQEGSAGNIYGVSGSPSSVHAKLTLAEATRLKIPLLCGMDIIHGFKTVFPIPLGLACSWDTLLIKKTARVAAIEGSAIGINWTFSPMVDLTRDPRWGRVMEGSGEDPY